MLSLSREDQYHLDQLEKQFQLVRDRTLGVVEGYYYGLFLYGEGGLGKSYTVLRELERLKANYKIFNSRMTGRGVFDTLKEYPDAIHVIEDAEQLLYDRGAQGVLRSALWAQRKEGETGPAERLVTWTTYRKVHSFVFTGGIIITANRVPSGLPEVEAIATRVILLDFKASDLELRALMRSVSLQGYVHTGKRLLPDECLKVCEFVIEKSASLHRRLNMRLLVNSFMDYLQWIEGDAGCHWQDLVASRLHERPTTFRVEVSRLTRAERSRQELELARRIRDTTADRTERLSLWEKETGKSEQTLYRRLEKLAEMEREEQARAESAEDKK